MNTELILVNGELTTLRELFDKYDVWGKEHNRLRKLFRERVNKSTGEEVYYLGNDRLVIERYDSTELEREIVELIAKLDSTRGYDPVGEERLEELMRRYLRER